MNIVISVTENDRVSERVGNKTTGIRSSTHHQHIKKSHKFECANQICYSNFNFCSNQLWYECAPVCVYCYIVTVKPLNEIASRAQFNNDNALQKYKKNIKHLMNNSRTRRRRGTTNKTCTMFYEWKVRVDLTCNFFMVFFYASFSACRVSIKYLWCDSRNCSVSEQVSLFVKKKENERLIKIVCSI